LVTSLKNPVIANAAKRNVAISFNRLNERDRVNDWKY